MTVSNREISSPHRSRSLDVPRLTLGGVGAIVGITLWLIGARYTIDGAILIVNSLLTFLRIPLSADLPPTWTTYGAWLLLPVACSVIEWQQRPWFVSDQGVRWAPLEHWVVWLLVYAADATTTWYGLGVPTDTAPLVLNQFAQSLGGRALLTAVLTLGPEWLLRRMFDILRSPYRR